MNMVDNEDFKEELLQSQNRIALAAEHNLEANKEIAKELKKLNKNYAKINKKLLSPRKRVTKIISTFL